MFKNFIAILVCLTMLPVLDSLAQGRYSNSSLYSEFGIGEPIDFRSSQAHGMGVTGVALGNRVIPGTSNPAHWGSTYFTLLSGGVALQTYGLSGNFGSKDNSNVMIGNLQVQFPVIREKLGVSFSVSPITRSSYGALNTSTYVTPGVNPSAEADTLVFSIFRREEGGLNRMELGVGYVINPYISVGYAASLVFGAHLSDVDTVPFDVALSPVGFTQRGSAHGIGNRFGLYAAVPRVLARQDPLTLGLTVSLPVLLRVEQELTADVDGTRIVVKTPDEFRAERVDNMQLPLEVTFGLAYFPTRILTTSAEVLYQNWSDYRNFSGINEDFLQDRLKFGAGIEYAALRRGETGFFNNFLYRAGVSFDTGHLVLSNQSIQTLMFSGGVGIPSIASGSSVDLNFDFGLRGTTSHELVRERIFAVRLTFNLTEMMFVRRKFQ